MWATYNPETRSFEGIISSFNKLKEIKIPDELQKSLEKVDISLVKTTEDLEGLMNHYGIAKKSAIDFAQKIKDGDIVLEEGQTMLQGYESNLAELPKGFDKAAIKAKALQLSMKALSSIGWAALFTAISWGISKGIETIDNYVHRFENAKEAMQDANSAFEESASNAKS